MSLRRLEEVFEGLEETDIEDEVGLWLQARERACECGCRRSGLVSPLWGLMSRCQERAVRVWAWRWAVRVTPLRWFLLGASLEVKQEKRTEKMEVRAVAREATLWARDLGTAERWDSGGS
jgi:hypothetical protein